MSRSVPVRFLILPQLRQVTQAERQKKQEDAAKCPVPRPILNVLTRKRKVAAPPRSDQEYVQDQLESFRERYGKLPGYQAADTYLESILCLATQGQESPKAKDVLAQGVYDESYRRLLSVLASVGVVLQEDGVMASKLVDQDICLSMMDKLKSPVEEETKEEESELGGVLLSSKEPSMTRQLNVLSNIVQRALLFGGDQELLVLAETLDADREAFAGRWYEGGLDPELPLEEETRPGLQYLNAMVTLLRLCYQDGVVTDLSPPLPLSNSYANAYERLVATAVELGSGYLKPVSVDVRAMPKPRTAQEELGRFAVWESNFRQSNPDASSYPDDLIGTWEVKDEIGGETIGLSTVVLNDNGAISVTEPMEGLRWRLDPGPTHLDTCTFQVLGSDGTILQYRGFIDRGARLEARFSKRPIKIRGSVQFQMRNGVADYYKDMLPINYKEGTTKFVMTKLSDDS